MLSSSLVHSNGFEARVSIGRYEVRLFCLGRKLVVSRTRQGGTWNLESWPLDTLASAELVSLAVFVAPHAASWLVTNFGRRPRRGKRFLWVDSPHQFSKEEEFYFNFLPPHTPTPLKSEENKEINPFLFLPTSPPTPEQKKQKKFRSFLSTPSVV